MTQLITKTPKDNYFHSQLRKAGYKVTPARLAILSVLNRAKKPLNVQQIMDRLEDKKIDTATVYRNLNTLKTSGLVLHIDFQQTHALYELATKGDHHHVVCTQCDQVEDVHNCALDHMTKEALKQSNFASITNHSLEFFGLCKNCKR